MSTTLESQDNIEVKREYWNEAKTEIHIETWYKDGKCHRLDVPAYQSWHEDGQKDYECWYKNGKRHRLDGPSFLSWYSGGQKDFEYWFKDDNLHRLGGPAVQRWYKDGQKELEGWYINGIEYTKEQFDEYIKGLDKEDLEMISDLGQLFD